MARRLAALVACLGLAACFNPDLSHTHCSVNNTCPEKMECDLATDLCVPIGGETCTGPECFVTVSELPVAYSKLDLLFVIDTSGSMYEEIPLAPENVRTALQVLAAVTLPDLHVGVVTTDLGAGGYELSGCYNDGDGALLLAGVGCFSSGQYASTAEENYPGGLADAVACAVPDEPIGCGFQQPLEAMRRALDGSVPENTGFLRDDAILAVVFVTDGDDCSASDTGLFDPAAEEELGPISAFRCFEHGVVCDPDEPRELGDKTDCRSREDSAYVSSISSYVESLLDIKGTSAQIQLALAAGDETQVNVIELEGTTLGLDESECSDAFTAAGPPIRMAELLSWFPVARTHHERLCDHEGSYGAELVQNLIGVASPDQDPETVACVEFDIDLDGADGIQSDCVGELIDPGPGATSSTPVPQCSQPNPDTDQRPCWLLDPALGAGCADSGVAARVYWNDAQDTKTFLLRCVLPE